MGLILKLIALPFKIIDELLEFLIFKVLFHRRLWFITLPLAIGGGCYAWYLFNYHVESAGPRPSPSATIRPASPAPRSPTPSASPSPRASIARIPRASVSPAVAPPRASATPRPAPVPAPSLSGPSPAATPRSPQPSPAPANDPLLAEVSTFLASRSSVPPTTAELDLVLAVARLGPDPAARAVLDRLAAAGHPARQQWALAGRLIAGDPSAADLLRGLPPDPELDRLSAAERGRLIAEVLKKAPTETRLATLERLATSSDPVPAEAGAVLVTLVSARTPASIAPAAARALARVTDPSVRPLAEAVLDRSTGETRAGIVRMLAGARSPRARPEIDKLLTSKDNAIRAQALHALADLAETDLPADVVVNALDDPDDRVRHAAARILVDTGDTRGIDVLTRDLSSPVASVREGATLTLALVSESRRATTIHQILSDKGVPAQVKIALIRIVARSPSRAHLATLQALLASRRDTVRLRTIESLHPAQVELLAQVLSERLTRDESPEVRFALARALAPRGAAGGAALVELARAGPARRAVAARALWTDPDRLRALLEVPAGPEDPAVRAAWSLAARLTLRASGRENR